jgi:hypothetical protein
VSKNTKPTIDQLLTNLTHEVLLGKAYLEIARGLTAADPVVVNSAPTFFGLTREAGFQMSQMFAAKLYDKTSGTVTMDSLLDAAECYAGVFKHGTRQEVSAAVKDAQKRMDALLPIFTAVRDRRNQAIAHLDPKTVTDPKALETEAKLTVKDLEKIFSETEAILNEFSRLWINTTAAMKFIGDDDYSFALDQIADAKHTLADKYESEFHQPWPHQRPRKPKSLW